MAFGFMTEIICSGAFFLAKDTKRFLFLQRSAGRTAGTWGLVGGKKEPIDYTAYQALEREIKEEIGRAPNIKKVIPLELFVSEDQHFQYHTYVLLVDREFIPLLNEEHEGYCWVSYNNWPKPLHQGVKRSLNNKTNRAKLDLLLDLITKV
jgi:8-oxo-dGTP pyrophosphatase MutT (NUDIX family)